MEEDGKKARDGTRVDNKSAASLQEARNFALICSLFFWEVEHERCNPKQKERRSGKVSRHGHQTTEVSAGSASRMVGGASFTQAKKT